MKKRIARYSAVVSLGLLIFAALPGNAMKIRPGDAAPELELADIDGNTVILSEFRGKTVIVVFWSTWCSRCSEELTFLRDNFGGREDMAVLLINQDSGKTGSRQRIEEMRDRLALPFPVIIDTGLELWDRFGIDALPTSVVIGTDGRVVFAEPNFFRGSPEKLLRSLSPDNSCLRCNGPFPQYTTD